MLKQKIQEDFVKAMKSVENINKETLRMLSAEILSKEKEKRYKILKNEPNLKEQELIKKSELTDEEIIKVISFEIKKRKDAIALYEKGNRPELVKKEKKEIEILKKYLPEQIPEEELRKLAKEAIDKVGAKEVKEMGKVMAKLMPKIKGKADSSEVSRIVKELLSG